MDTLTAELEHATLRRDMQEIAAVQAHWVAVRDEFARLCAYHRFDGAAHLEDMHSWACELSAELQCKVRRDNEG